MLGTSSSCNQSASDSFVSKLDSMPTCYGENGHAQHGWSEPIGDKLVQIYFQTTRTNQGMPAKYQTEYNAILQYFADLRARIPRFGDWVFG